MRGNFDRASIVSWGQLVAASRPCVRRRVGRWTGTCVGQASGESTRGNRSRTSSAAPHAGLYEPRPHYDRVGSCQSALWLSEGSEGRASRALQKEKKAPPAAWRNATGGFPDQRRRFSNRAAFTVELSSKKSARKCAKKPRILREFQERKWGILGIRKENFGNGNFRYIVEKCVSVSLCATSCTLWQAAQARPRPELLLRQHCVHPGPRYGPRLGRCSLRSAHPSRSEFWCAVAHP